MAQQRASAPEDVYTALANDETFSGLIGVRRFEDGTELPAIALQAPGEELQGLRGVTGLEVVIHDTAPIDRTLFITSDQLLNPSWRVFLILWDGAPAGALHDAQVRALEIFSNATSVDVGSSPNGIGAIAQVQIIVPSTSIITTA